MFIAADKDRTIHMFTEKPFRKEEKFISDSDIYEATPLIKKLYNDLKFEDDDAPSTEDIENAEKEVKKMTDEEIKIKALKQAVDVAKLMSDVTTDDVIDIAKKLAKFIKG